MLCEPRLSVVMRVRGDIPPPRIHNPAALRQPKNKILWNDLKYAGQSQKSDPPVIDSEIGDRAVFSGIVVLPPLVATMTPCSTISQPTSRTPLISALRLNRSRALAPARDRFLSLPSTRTRRTRFTLPRGNAAYIFQSVGEKTPACHRDRPQSR